MVTKTEEGINPSENVKANAASTEPQFGIQRIYVKDLSVEVPNSPAIFLEAWEPNVNMELNSSHKDLTNNMYEVILSITVNAKLKNDKTAFLVELLQGGVFSLVGFPQEQIPGILSAYCPNVLFPYAREVITDAIVRAGFPYLYLSPVNFDAIYHKQLERDRSENKEEATSN